ncbi:MAG: hypothetical protein FH748_14965 [Balneolaceae bacterium]|nr:hypothetical protein [Balneolaceae bacterium]
MILKTEKPQQDTSPSAVSENTQAQHHVVPVFSLLITEGNPVINRLDSVDGKTVTTSNGYFGFTDGKGTLLFVPVLSPLRLSYFYSDSFSNVRKTLFQGCHLWLQPGTTTGTHSGTPT